MRQRRWLELLADYDCEIRYHPGKENVVADALSRKERIKPLRRLDNAMSSINLKYSIHPVKADCQKPSGITSYNQKIPIVPISIISDRDSHFTSRFSKKSLPSAFGYSIDMSTAYHPGFETDGQSERHQTLKTLLRALLL
ncbi:putative reverse transcriptase domain-containing protein [Tanacetum coccineum]